MVKWPDYWSVLTDTDTSAQDFLIEVNTAKCVLVWPPARRGKPLTEASGLSTVQAAGPLHRKEKHANADYFFFLWDH